MMNNLAFGLFIPLILCLIAPEVIGGATGRLSKSNAEPFVKYLSVEEQKAKNFTKIKCYACIGCKDATKLSSNELLDCEGNEMVTPINWEAAGFDDKDFITFGESFRGCLEVELTNRSETEKVACKTPVDFKSLTEGPKYYINPVCTMKSDAYGVNYRGCYKNYVEGFAKTLEEAVTIRGECGKVDRIKDDPNPFTCYCKEDKCNSGIKSGSNSGKTEGNSGDNYETQEETDKADPGNKGSCKSIFCNSSGRNLRSTSILDLDGLIFVVSIAALSC